MAGTPTPTEGAVDWKAAEEFLTKGTQSTEPGASDDAPEDTAPPEDVEVSIRGRKVKMTSEAAEAYADFVKETRERDGRLGGEIASLRERTAKAEGMIETLRAPVREVDIKPPDARLASTDLEAWQTQWVAYHEAKSAKLAADLEAQRLRESRTRQAAVDKEQHGRAWADRFYGANPHLNDSNLKPLVHSVYVEHAAELDGLPDRDAHERLAELADERVLAIRSAGKTNPTSKPPRLEGPGGASPKAPVEKDRAFTSASWSARKQAELRGDKIKPKE